VLLRPTCHYIAVTAVLVDTMHIDQFRLGSVSRERQRPVVAVSNARAVVAPPRDFGLVSSTS
jgi:hypothetical protein